MTDWKERAERAEAELARLRAQVPVGWIGPSGFTHNTATNRMWMRESPKLAAKLSPVYAAPPAQPAEPRNTCPDCNSPTILPCAYCGCKNYPKDAQPADPIAARSRYETAYAGHQLPHTQTTTSEPVQLTEVEIFKAYTTATGEVLPNIGSSRAELVAITRIIEQAHGITGAKK